MDALTTIATGYGSEVAIDEDVVAVVAPSEDIVTVVAPSGTRYNPIVLGDPDSAVSGDDTGSSLCDGDELEILSWSSSIGTVSRATVCLLLW